MPDSEGMPQALGDQAQGLPMPAVTLPPPATLSSSTQACTTGVPQLDLSIQTVYILFLRCHLTTGAAVQKASKPLLPYFRDKYFPTAFSTLPLIILSAQAYIQMWGNGEAAGALHRRRARQPSPQGQTDPGKSMLGNPKVSL